MKQWIYLLVFTMSVGVLAACSKNTKEEEQPYQRKKIYLTEADYMEDLDKQAFAERRQAKPVIESNYIFELQPETEKHVYFFDERTRPMVPGEPGEHEYAKTKRLWEKPRRYSPDQYYGNQPAAADTSSSSSSYSDYGYDY